jgi:hypothetical protein
MGYRTRRLEVLRGVVVLPGIIKSWLLGREGMIKGHASGDDDALASELVLKSRECCTSLFREALASTSTTTKRYMK